MRSGPWHKNRGLLTPFFGSIRFRPFFCIRLEPRVWEETSQRGLKLLMGSSASGPLPSFVRISIRYSMLIHLTNGFGYRIASEYSRPLGGKRRFSDLDELKQQELLSKGIDVFVIEELADPDEVRDLFIRLQSGTALSRQQIRDAWPGTVGPYIERLAGKLNRAPSIGLFRQIDRRGSRVEDDTDQYDSDRQFCAQLLCLFLARERDPLSQQSIGANELDKLYHENTTFEVHGEAARRFEEALKITNDVFTVASISTVFKSRMKSKFKKLDVIAAFLLVQDLSRSPHFKFDKTFQQKVADHILAEKDGVSGGKSTSGPAIAKYYDNWRAAIIEDIGIRLDPKRAFDEADKTALYKLAEGKCLICGEPVEHKDAEYDHYPTPHYLGGKTVVENGRLVHSICHPRGRPVGNGRSTA